MNFMAIFLKNLIKSFNSFFGSVFPTTTSGSISLSSIYGTAEMIEEDFANGTVTITSASSASSAFVDTATHYDINVTQAYVESMNELEATELIERLEALNVEEKPKVLAKNNNNNNYYM